MTARLTLAGLLLTACITAVPTRDADLAALDACSRWRDRPYTALRSSVAAGLNEGHRLVAILDGFGVFNARIDQGPGVVVGIPSTDAARYITQTTDWGAKPAAQANRDRLPALRACLEGKGYRFGGSQ